MKATGIVRRIDDLGRVVIPKEIRRTLRIREGDPLEIFTDREGEVILKKYSPIGELGTLAKLYAESLAQTLGCTVCITDMDQVVAVSGSGRKELQDQYMFGSEYLVAPIFHLNEFEREVYLPEGRWEDTRDGKVYEGGQTIRAAAPIDSIPVFKKMA